MPHTVFYLVYVSGSPGGLYAPERQNQGRIHLCSSTEWVNMDAEWLQRWKNANGEGSLSKAPISLSAAGGTTADYKKKLLYREPRNVVDPNTTRKHSSLKWKHKVSCNAYWNRTRWWGSVLLGNINFRKRKPAKFLQCKIGIKVPGYSNNSILTACKADTKSVRVSWRRWGHEFLLSLL